MSKIIETVDYWNEEVYEMVITLLYNSQPFWKL